MEKRTAVVKGFNNISPFSTDSSTSPWLVAFTSNITTMTSPRTLASRSAIIALLACALSVASAAPGVVEPTTAGISSDVFDNIRSQSRRLSEIIRAGLPAPELRSAVGGRIARARPEPTIRGRSLAAKKICEWNPCGADEEDCKDCDLKASVVNDFKPETPEGRAGFDILKPVVTCMDITLEDECKMKPSCNWFTDEDPGYCDGDWNSILTAPVPASACTAAEKVDVTMNTIMTREVLACQKFQTESTCNAAKGLTCEWQDDGTCSVGAMKFFMDLVTGSAKGLHTVVALGRQADACATKTTQSTCAAVTECAWNSVTSLCDVADATVKSIAGVETLSGVLSKWNTCQSKSQTDCTGDCKWANGNCELTSKTVSETLVDGMSDGAFKTFIADGTYCTNSRASDGTTSDASLLSCWSNNKFENGTSLPGYCYVTDELKHVVAGKPECFYFPGMTWLAGIFTAPYPGYDKMCPNIMDRFIIKNTECQKASTKAECGTGNYKECKWGEYTDDEGDRCEFNGDYIWKLIVGDVDGDHLISIMSSCGTQSSEAACGGFEKDIDFFGLKYPEKSKVKTTLGFANIDSMDKSKAEELQKAVADAVGGDVKADEVVIKGVQFPVESKIELSTSKSDIDKDRAGFETKFKTGLAADLGVLPSDIVIKDIKESSRRRRGLLSSHVQVDFEVDGAPDAVRAKALASQVQSGGGLSNLKTDTGATPTIPAGTTPSYELRVEVEPMTSYPDGVATMLNTATITMDGQTAKVENEAKVEKNTAVVSAANGAFSVAVAFLAAIAGVAFLA